MRAALDEACEQGALGFSSGLIYTPGTFAPIEELVELSKIAAAHDIPYVTHMRDEMDGVDAAIDEALRIGAESGAAVQISHHKTAGKRNWRHTKATLDRIERARAEGIDVAIDVYPREAEAVLADVVNEYVSVESAREDYGVVIDAATMTVDEGATSELRGATRTAVAS
jgi:N-acyl-D-aspartate/D-glutamate deacylase